ncbi:ribonuclease III domain-containing protein [Chytriomyces sp. MP71]|nr:ribonuclease III domain-containing protein [Chytriomyces sp. MP71]
MTQIMTTSVRGYRFLHPELLRSALVHPGSQLVSALQFQRLEFLGDRVLGLAVADRVFHAHPTEAEGILALRTEALVNKHVCAAMARAVGLHESLVLAEDAASTLATSCILGDAFEALIGAIYEDSGRDFPLVAKWINDLIDSMPSYSHASATPTNLFQTQPPKDAKSALNIYSQARTKMPPVYSVSTTGPAHAPLMTCTVSLGGGCNNHRAGRGQGMTVKEAERRAAADLLAQLGEGPL